jgi:hypothetical protein
MNLWQHWKIIASLAGLFLLGAVSGAFVTLRVAQRHPSTPAMEDKWVHRTLRDYEERLHLTPEQVTKLRPFFKQTGLELRQLRATTVTNLHATIRRMNEQISTELTPDQRQLFTEILKEKQPPSDRSEP